MCFQGLEVGLAMRVTGALMGMTSSQQNDDDEDSDEDDHYDGHNQLDVLTPVRAFDFFQKEKQDRLLKKHTVLHVC